MEKRFCILMLAIVSSAISSCHTSEIKLYKEKMNAYRCFFIQKEKQIGSTSVMPILLPYGLGAPEANSIAYYPLPDYTDTICKITPKVSTLSEILKVIEDSAKVPVEINHNIPRGWDVINSSIPQGEYKFDELLQFFVSNIEEKIIRPHFPNSQQGDKSKNTMPSYPSAVLYKDKIFLCTIPIASQEKTKNSTSTTSFELKSFLLNPYFFLSIQDGDKEIIHPVVVPLNLSLNLPSCIESSCKIEETSMSVRDLIQKLNSISNVPIEVEGDMPTIKSFHWDDCKIHLNSGVYSFGCLLQHLLAMMNETGIPERKMLEWKSQNSGKGLYPIMITIAELHESKIYIRAIHTGEKEF